MSGLIAFALLLIGSTVALAAEPLVLTGHTSTTRPAFSPNGKIVASASDDKTVRLWDAATGKHLRTLSRHEGGVWRVLFSPDGGTLASINADETAILWDVETGKPRHVLRGHTGMLRSVAFSPDGTTLATGSTDETVRLWSTKTADLLRTLAHRRRGELPEIIWCLAYSPDGKLLVAGIGDGVGRAGMVCAWDSQTGKPHHTLESPRNEQVWGIAFTPDGDTLVSGSTSGTITLWDIDGWKQKRSFPAHVGLRGLAISPQGTTLAVAVQREIRLLNLSTGKVEQTLRGHGNWVLHLSFSPDGKWLASGSSDRTVRLWPVGKGTTD